VNYFEITAKCEEVNESSYTNQSTGEVITKIQLSLVVPSMRDRVLCELPIDKAPKPELLDKWELEETWLVVSAEGMRALALQRNNVRAGQKPVAALVVFQAAEVREATLEEPLMLRHVNTHRQRAHISLVDRLEYFLRSRASKVVVLALVANTVVAQLLYNSAGQLVLGNAVLLYACLCPVRGQYHLSAA
jgi:hypothetical protein